MISIIGIGVMAMASFSPKGKEPYQLPGVTLCDKGSCAIELDDQGYLVTSDSKTKVFSKPVKLTMFNSYSLYKSGGEFILESESTSSSKNWSTFVFSYNKGKVRAVRYIDLSRSIVSSSKGGAPDQVAWSGRDCRGDAFDRGDGSPFESASDVLCGVSSTERSEDRPNNELVKRAATLGLVVTVPSYGSSAKSGSPTTYFFPQADEPDAGALLCLNNCGSPGDGEMLGGEINNSLWIDMNVRLDSGNKYVGTYSYIGKKGYIPLEGMLGESDFRFEEFKPSDSDRKGGAVAIMEGTREGDGLIGTWSAKSSGKKFDMLLARRIY